MHDNKLFMLKLFYFVITLFNTACKVFCTDCKVEDYNLQVLNKFSPWIEKDGNNTYYISICKKIETSAGTSCPDGTAVCMKDKDGATHSIGNYSDSLVSSVNSLSREIVLSFEGSKCTQNAAAGNLKTYIFLKCGKTLGSPKFLDVLYGCDYHFEWYTTSVCTDLPVTDKEVPCYVFNGKDKFDLSPLIKVTGAYLVSSANNRKIYINVCRDISKDATVTECILGSGSCSIIDGKGSDLGQPATALERTSDGDLKLYYTTDTKIAGVSQHTTILFSCPKRGGSKHPELTSDFSGEYMVRWVTEHACPQSYLTSKTCKLTSAQHDIDIDLAPLAKKPYAKDMYLTLSHDGKYKYYINICNEMGIQCGMSPDSRAQTVLCQEKPKEASFSKSLGRKDSQVLRYADGELTLTYSGGDTCHTNFKRTTVISFHCNETAGIGAPHYNYDNNCTYFFDWDTDHACPGHPNIEECRATYKGHIYDLSSLVRESENWQVVNSFNQNNDQKMYINMCHKLIRNGSASACPDESAACLTSNSFVHNLGKYTANPTYQPADNSIQIVYTDGDSCTGGKKISSIVKIMCKIGDSSSAPILTEVSDDQCTYMFEWHISTACPLKHIMGDNCRITDVDSGISLDLSKLTKKDGYYTATVPSGHAYDYYINVCSDVKINSGTCSSDTPHAGVCQVRKSGSHHKFNTGKASSKLQYFDGMINLTYSGGDLYRSTPPAPRTTEINFRCNKSAGAGNPVYVAETNKTYVFKWDTKFACLSQSVECVVTDDKTGKQYDLSRLTKTGTDNWHKSDILSSRTYYINVCQSLNPINSIVNSAGCDEMAAVCVTRTSDGKQEVEHGNLGQVTNGPVIENDNIKIEYKNGDSCVNDAGVKTSYTTIIHFRCIKGAVENGPLTPILNRPCEYTIMWQTEAACPIEETVVTETCILKDTSSDYVFNFQHLKKKADEEPYTFKSFSSGKTYKLNICGGTNACQKIGNDESSVCVDQGSSATSPGIAFAKPEMKFSTEGKIRLVYHGARSTNGDQNTVAILFICNTTKEPGEFTSVRELGGNNLVFEFVTAAACRPKAIECSAVDEDGEEYNLKPLADRNSAWEIVDPTRPDLKYFISVCKPLPPSTESSCIGEAIGGCQTSSKRAKSYNMGFIQSMPVAVKNAVVLHYRNGDLCHVGKPNQAHRSTTINFICSPHEHHPVSDGETHTCEYLFSWSTPSACPVKQVIGSNCKVTDPLYNYEFDLSSLHKSTGSYSVEFEDYTYLINACGGINVDQGGCPVNTGNCQTKKASSYTPVNAGFANDKLMYNGGEITLKYVDGKTKCHGKYNRTTIITFHCDHSTSGLEGPSHWKEDEVCTYLFNWNTSAACPPHKIVDCTVIDKNGYEYDLSNLALSSDNYNYEDPLAPKKKKVPTATLR